MDKKIVTVEDVLNGCICAVVELAGDEAVLRNVCCPLHGDNDIISEIKRRIDDES